MKLRLWLLFGLLLMLGGAANAAAGDGGLNSKDKDAIQALLSAQAAAWNRGDIDGFMQGYWKNDALRFASGDRVTTGWQATLERYRKRYADRAAMGSLSFVELDIEPLAEDAALVFGHWSLTRDQDQPHGLFTLLLRKTAEGWRITRDHTSTAEP